MRFAGKDLRCWLNSRDNGDLRLPRIYRYKPEKIKMAGAVRGQSMAARPARCCRPGAVGEVLSVRPGRRRLESGVARRASAVALCGPVRTVRERTLGASEAFRPTEPEKSSEAGCETGVRLGVARPRYAEWLRKVIVAFPGRRAAAARLPATMKIFP